LRLLKTTGSAITKRHLKADLNMTIQDLLIAQGLSDKDLVQELGIGE